jgi:hypothetical protein
MELLNGFAAQANTGDPENFSWLIDFTPEVTDAKFGTGQQSQVYNFSTRISTVAASAVTNIATKLYFTYEYEESTAAKLVKTVRIPIQSHHTTLLTTQSEVGVFTGALPAPPNQIPALSTFLPETDGRIIHQAWIEMYANTAGASTTDHSATYKIDSSGSEAIRATYEAALNGGALSKDIWIWNTASYVIDSTHRFNAAASVAARMECIGGFMGVTYSYNNNSGTNPTRLNSVVVGGDAVNKAIYMNGSGSGDMDWRFMKLFIAEKNPSLKQSAQVIHLMSAGGGTLGMIGGKQQLSRSYSLVNLTNAGGSIVHHRIDHSGTFALAEGENVLTSSYLAAAASSIGFWGTWAYVNYTSDCSPFRRRSA